MKTVLLSSLCVFLLTGCSTKSQMTDTTPRGRTFKEWRATGFHQPIQLRIGWYPYEEGQLAHRDSNIWSISFSDSNRIEGKMPAIIIRHAGGGDSLTVGLDVDDALLGKLLKHSLITEIPIARPFDDFFQKADCAKCHPSDIKLNK